VYVAILDGALTALPFLRDAAGLKAGQSILINGASGAVGTAAVQFAKHFGADVTAVCSTANLDLVKSLGADETIDYKAEDFTETAESYDVVFDAVGKAPTPDAGRS
jgi:NADPH:quinone reductase-like Zn-dependent oxidoreductase